MSYVSFYADKYIFNWPPQIKIDKTVKRVPLYMTPCASIHGKVLDAEGRPAAGVWVRGTSGGVDLTNTDGTFALHFEPRAKRIYLAAQDRERNLCDLTEVVEDQNEYTLKLRKGIIVKGRVTDDQGRPIPGALITSEGYFSCRAITNEEGFYTFTAVPPTRDEITYGFSAFAVKYGLNRIRHIRIDHSADKFVLPDIKLTATDCAVSGIVVDKAGKPQPNLPVFLSGDWSEWDHQPHLVNRTDDEGRFRFEKVCKGPLKVQAGVGTAPHGILYACGGDQNLELIFPEIRVHPEHASMIGHKIPSLELSEKPIDPNQVRGKKVAVCFWGIAPEVREKALEFSRQVKKLDSHEVFVCFVTIHPLGRKKDEVVRQFCGPVYDTIRRTDMNRLRRQWGARQVPWFVVANPEHVIVYEGTSPDEALAVLQ